MDDEQLFRRTESILYGYYVKLQDLERQRKALANVELRISEVRQMILDSDDLIPCMGIVTQYGGIGGHASGDPGDPTYQRYIVMAQSMDQARDTLAELAKQRTQLKLRIIRLEASIEGIGFAVGGLCTEDRSITEQRYLFKRSNLQVGMALGMDESTVRRRRKFIVDRVARCLRVVEKKMEVAY